MWGRGVIISAPNDSERIGVRSPAIAINPRQALSSGRRALLNFGHTLGHAIEAAAGYGTLYHGEAISLGMCAAACISRKRAGLSAEEVTRLEVLLEKFSLPTQLPPDLSPDQIIKRTFADKKFVRGQIRFVLASRLGHAFVSDEVTREDLLEAVAYLQSA